jgi:hypothetical protein
MPLLAHREGGETPDVSEGAPNALDHALDIPHRGTDEPLQPRNGVLLGNAQAPAAVDLR